MPEPPQLRRRWIDYLNDDELMFVRRFVVASGSLKKVAAAYSISYPTVRLRLDRLIQKIRLVEESVQGSHFERALVAEHADGRLDAETMKRLLEAYRQEKEEGS